jgi:hypothetical protein
MTTHLPAESYVDSNREGFVMSTGVSASCHAGYST